VATVTRLQPNPFPEQASPSEEWQDRAARAVLHMEYLERQAKEQAGIAA